MNISKFASGDDKMIEISVQKAKQGDSIWIRCLSDENVVNIVIDAGPPTFQNGFKNMVREIKEKKNGLIY